MKKRPTPVPTRASTAPTTRIKRKKRRFMLNVPKRGFYSQRRPAFDAFSIKSRVDNGMGKMVQKIEVIAPETGIHSKAWSLETKPQDTSLLKAPLEIRTRIFEMLFRSYDLILSPQKCGKGFANSVDGVVTLNRAPGVIRHFNPMKMYMSVALVCRKIYVEVVGGALLYRNKSIPMEWQNQHLTTRDGHERGQGMTPEILQAFTEAEELRCVGNLGYVYQSTKKEDDTSFHLSSITRITLNIRLTPSFQTIPKEITDILATAKNLQNLSIILSMDLATCQRQRPPQGNLRYAGLKEDLCVKIESSKNWGALKGLRSFEMTFETFWGRVRVSELVYDTDRSRCKAIEEEIRKVVMRAE